MAEYYISGVWKDTNGTITHYAVHLFNVAKSTIATLVKTNKVDAIKLVEAAGNTVTTTVWNYASGSWSAGEVVSVVNDSDGKYLKSAPDNKLSDNLGHLICWNQFIA